ncbi:threonine/serine exporter family protein [Aminipila terrae]|uniref:Threonine/serine exporter family protein n=1 Tax=Aminipila terrae TaxID=2697030 RepID=A0A6P1MLH8_9FIRM|nr:threonine/serine exporter family protein [Aminipila terrae]QHI72506.1 threonine/serine exporter family protein [Aminipila terrae]
MTYFLQFIFGFVSTVGFAILFHVPKRNIFMSSLVGGVGWVVFAYCRNDYGGALLGCFLASCVVGLLAGIFSRVYKETATVYTIPGIIPLVPGAGMYYTTLYLINGELSKAATTGTQTLLMAGSISVGLLVVGSFFKMHYTLTGKFKRIIKKT